MTASRCGRSYPRWSARTSPDAGTHRGRSCADAAHGRPRSAQPAPGSARVAEFGEALSKRRVDHQSTADVGVDRRRQRRGLGVSVLRMQPLGTRQSSQGVSRVSGRVNRGQHTLRLDQLRQGVRVTVAPQVCSCQCAVDIGRRLGVKLRARCTQCLQQRACFPMTTAVLQPLRPHQARISDFERVRERLRSPALAALRLPPRPLHRAQARCRCAR